LGSALDPNVGSSLIGPVNGGRLDRPAERERDVLDLMTQCLSKVAIATRLTLVGALPIGRIVGRFQRGNVPLLLYCN
jgi:hypothetical protein